MKLSHAALAFAVAFLMAFASPLAAAYRHNARTHPRGSVVVLKDNPGGSIVEFEQHFFMQRLHGDTVVIDGMCASACTMSIGIFKGRICATPNAFFGFHTAYQIDPFGHHIYAPDGTAEMSRWYTPEAQRVIANHGGLRPDIFWVTAPEIYQIVPPCQ